MSFPTLKKCLLLFPVLAMALVATCGPAQAQVPKSTVYTIPEAGVQMDLPWGWEASKDPNGSYVIVKKDADGYVVMSMNVLPREPTMTIDSLYAAFSEGIFDNAKKDWKGFKTGDLVKDTQSGMALRAQKLEGTVADSGGELEGLVVVFDSPKPLCIFAQRTKKHSDVLQKEGAEILASIKKIQ
jgi:hypothetical protein